MLTLLIIPTSVILTYFHFKSQTIERQTMRRSLCYCHEMRVIAFVNRDLCVSSALLLNCVSSSLGS